MLLLLLLMLWLLAVVDVVFSIECALVISFAAVVVVPFKAVRLIKSCYFL